ncbi:hypothetical protein E2562_019268 [Oryza meyeriana var. granulata]|uniref:SET domain-containing protein n=1 Tax=Oryza meyeriana var. granulata TaxID=110450 RepID=A0A6G1FAG4_9ORYZ|nr:hypothetical protein E2562_019268 [Oryza meyeriana var. granulata]
MEGIGIPSSESDGGSGDRGLENPPTGSTIVSEAGSGGRARRDCDLQGVAGGAAAKERNVLAKDSNLKEGVPDGKEATRVSNGTGEPTNLQGFQCNGTPNGSDLTATVCSNSEAFKISDSSVTGCRKGRKAVVPWRFQLGYKRSWSQCSGLGNGSGSHGPPETTESKFRDSWKQCAPAAGHNHSRVKVSVTSDHSSVKVRKQTGSVPKKMKVNRYGHYQKGNTNYVYGGLYYIEKFRMEKLKEDQHIPTFQLRRIAGQAQGISKTIPSLRNGPDEDEEIGFAVDALNWGNLARFINHSCSPNLFAQNILYDHDNKSMPHIMLFAAEDIPPLQELAYDYNYEVDKVHDSDGNIKKKKCFCGSIECTGRLY